MVTITTVLPAYNQEAYIDATITGAVRQIGDFRHEILASSDGSTDSTRDRIRAWQRRFPLLLRDDSAAANVGISKHFRRLFQEASGDFVAILEGDDLWTDPEKLEQQKNFLLANPDCPMVFSMIRVRQLPSGAESLLERQTALTRDKLTGEDFLADGSMNLIANFSSCMLRADVARAFPDRLFESRFNEIAMAFHLERIGPIGFLKKPMGIYHQHAGGVWTGISREAQLRSGLETREMVLDVAHPRHGPAIRKVIEDRYRKPLAALRADPAASSQDRTAPGPQ